MTEPEVNVKVRNGHLVESLERSLRSGKHGLSVVPDLLERVLTEGSWREFATQRDEVVRHSHIRDFVTTPPLGGLGATKELVERVIGTDRPDLLRLWREAWKVGQGTRSDRRPLVDSTRSRGAEDSANAVDRLARDAPGQYEAVRRGEKTINAAARAAGIRPHRISVRLDRPESIARSLRKHMSPDQLVELARLLTEEN